MIDYEPVVKDFFIGHGYRVEKIPEGDEESPDFLISDDTSLYILELKTKFPSEMEIEERRKSLEAGEFHNIHEPIISKNTLSGIIKKAKDQLDTHKEKDILRIVWLLATGHIAEQRMLQFEATLYGLTTLLDWSNKRDGDCFFFYNSEFFRYRDVLDAAIVSTESEERFLLNPLSPRYMQTKTSSLPKHFGKGLVDPIELEKDGIAFFVDSDVDRGDEEAVLRYLKDKYKSDNILNITMNFMSGTIAIPRTHE